jgi:hypothetical protein
MWSSPPLVCLANCRQHRAGIDKPITVRLQYAHPNLLHHAQTYAVSEHNYSDGIAMMLRLSRNSDLCTNRSIIALGHAYRKRDHLTAIG